MPTYAEEWVQEHGDVLYRYAISRTKDADLAEDLVQETLLAAMRGRNSYEGKSSERTWLIGILRHKTLDYFRRSSKERSLQDFEIETLTADNAFNEAGGWASPPSEWSAPDQALEQDEFWARFGDCLDRLPEPARIAFMLREFDGLDGETLASTMNITTNNLWVVLSRARSKLRQCLQIHWFSGEPFK